MMNLMRRAILLHVVALNVTIKHRAITDDERLWEACSFDWALRVRCGFNHEGSF